MAHQIREVVDYYLEISDTDPETIQYARYVRTAKDILILTGGVRKSKELLMKTKEWAESRGLEWSIETATKKYLELSQ